MSVRRSGAGGIFSALRTRRIVDRADPVAELKQLTLDPPVSPAVVLGREPLDQRGDLGADRRPSRPARVSPLAGDQAAVPPHDGNRPVHPQLCRQEPDERREDGAVCTVEPGPGIGTAQHGDLVPQHQQLGVLKRQVTGRAGSASRGPGRR